MMRGIPHDELVTHTGQRKTFPNLFRFQNSAVERDVVNASP